MSDFKKLVVVSSSFFPFAGGQEVGLEDLIDGIKKNIDCQISIITPRYDRNSLAEETRRGVKIFRYPTTTVPYPRSLMSQEFNLSVHMIYAAIAIPRLLKRLKPDRILAYFLSPTAYSTVRYARNTGIECALFLGGSDIHHMDGRIRFATRFALEHASSLIATSRYVRDCARMNFGVLEKPFALVPYPIDLGLFPPLSKEPVEERRILAVQRLIPSKGTHFLIKALALLAGKRSATFSLDVIGDGPQRAELEHLTHELGLRKQIVFHGEQPHERMADFFKRSQIFCFPTLSEGFGIVLLEAMATGNIIVASHCTAIPEIIRHGETGLLFESGNVKALARVLEAILEHPDRYENIADAARKAVKKYDVRRVGKRLVDALSRNDDG